MIKFLQIVVAIFLYCLAALIANLPPLTFILVGVIIQIAYQIQCTEIK